MHAERSFSGLHWLGRRAIAGLAAFAGASAGVNRISLGIQTFDDSTLHTLGRIHEGNQARVAIRAIKDAGFDNFNLDLMWALPGQIVDEAVADVEQALSFDPAHISHYQLTIEPNTVFAARPPTLPDEETVWTMQDACGERLSACGYENFDISACRERVGDATPTYADEAGYLIRTERGAQYLNDLQALFLTS